MGNERMKQATSVGGSSRLMLIVSVLAFGTVGLFVRGINLPAQEIALYRAVIALLVLVVIMSLTGRFAILKQHKQDVPKFLITGAVMAFNWLLLFEAYNHTTIALATLSYYLAPTLMILFGVLFLKERLTMFQVLCFVLSTLGLVLMLGVSTGSAGDLKGILLGLSSAVLYATVVTINRGAAGVDGIVRTFTQFVGVILVMVPFIAFRGGFHFSELSAPGLLSLLTLGVLHTGLCYCLYFISIVRLKAQQVAILSYLDPLTAVLLSTLLLGEKISALQLLGGAMMLIFSLLNELNPQKPKTECPLAPDRV
ncbi:MAG: EamA family transporter [Bacillota bacterium]|nr:EamA family transporter [Bacillota bacterium]